MEHIIFGVISLIFNGIETVIQYGIRNNHKYFGLGMKMPYTEKYPQIWKTVCLVYSACCGIAFVFQCIALYYLRSGALSAISAITMLFPVIIATMAASVLGKKYEKQEELQIEKERHMAELEEQIVNLRKQ